MPRSIALASLISGGHIEGVSPWIDVELWRDRLIVRSVSREAAAANRVEHAKSWAQIQVAVRLDDSIPASIVNNVAGIPPLTQQMLLERHNQLVQLITKFWDIEHDSDGVYLPGLTEEQFVSSTGGRQV